MPAVSLHNHNSLPKQQNFPPLLLLYLCLPASSPSSFHQKYPWLMVIRGKQSRKRSARRVDETLIWHISPRDMENDCVPFLHHFYRNYYHFSLSPPSPSVLSGCEEKRVDYRITRQSALRYQKVNSYHNYNSLVITVSTHILSINSSALYSTTARGWHREIAGKGTWVTETGVPMVIRVGEAK